ncbi:MAG: transcriptional repressor LexA [Oscillospiraceae bacterium]|nr:transcriptional repressor LexA [Oscillospiraceae bacterium]
MKELNDIQKKMYEFLAEQAQKGKVPTVREICRQVGLKSTGTTQRYLERLEEAGYIERDPLHSRSIRLTGERRPTVQVPLIGTVTAGMPILAYESIEGYVPFMGSVDNSKSLFALRVRGDSMINAGILNGDIIIAEKTPSAANGEIVVALIEDEATVKRFYKENGHFRLQPENNDYEPIITEELIILGKVVSLIRNY